LSILTNAIPSFLRSKQNVKKGLHWSSFLRYYYSYKLY